MKRQMNPIRQIVFRTAASFSSAQSEWSSLQEEWSTKFHELGQTISTAANQALEKEKAEYEVFFGSTNVRGRPLRTMASQRELTLVFKPRRGITPPSRSQALPTKTERALNGIGLYREIRNNIGNYGWFSFSWPGGSGLRRPQTDGYASLYYQVLDKYNMAIENYQDRLQEVLNEFSEDISVRISLVYTRDNAHSAHISVDTGETPSNMDPGLKNVFLDFMEESLGLKRGGLVRNAKNKFMWIVK